MISGLFFAVVRFSPFAPATEGPWSGEKKGQNREKHSPDSQEPPSDLIPACRDSTVLRFNFACFPSRTHCFPSRTRCGPQTQCHPNRPKLALIFQNGWQPLPKARDGDREHVPRPRTQLQQLPPTQTQCPPLRPITPKTQKVTCHPCASRGPEHPRNIPVLPPPLRSTAPFYLLLSFSFSLRSPRSPR